MSTNKLLNDNYPKVTYCLEPINSNETVEFQSLKQAISNCAVPLVHQLIQQTPALVHQKGWHGQTALHKAALVGDWSICFLLLEAGSDPNALNDFNETPVHYACKRGLANVLHLLHQRKGDLTALDKNKMGSAHHCALTGNVYAFMYLESQGINLQELDKNLQSPLHVVCYHGHVDLFKFLLKKERSNLQQADIDGNTPLHITAREGHSFLCWLILSQEGCSLLHIKNRAGFTPVDLAGQRDKIGHLEITPVLTSYAKSDKSLIPRGPLLLWYWLLLMPTVVYAAMVAVAMLSGDQYQGYIMIIGMFLLLFAIGKHYHRLDHPSRWPNPVYAGTFGAGLAHTILLYFLRIFPYLQQYTLVNETCLLGILVLLFFYWKVLTREPDTKYYTVLSMICMVLATALVYFYYKVLTQEPGALKQSICDKETGRPMTIEDLCVPHRKIDTLCFTCELTRDAYTKHCKLCDKCYVMMDHHCLFLLKCVAKNNRRQFILFIAFVLFCMLIFLGNTLLYCSNVYTGLTIWDAVKRMFFGDCWVLSMVGMHVASILWGINLLRYQLVMVSKGDTTVFRKRESVLTSNERLLNVVYFLLGREPFVVDPLTSSQFL